jgi:hypothetical protein
MWHNGAKARTGGAGPGGWARVSAPGTSASFVMPGQPQTQTTRHVHDDGTPFVQTQAVSRTASGYFAVSVVDVEGGLVGDPLRELDAVTEAVAEELHFAEQRVTRLDVPGFYGRQVAGRTNEGVVVIMRSYLGFRRIYTAVVGVPDTPASEPVVAAFLDGVELDPSDTLYPHATTAASRPDEAVWAPVFMPEDDFGVEMPVVSEVSVGQIRIAEREAAVRTYESTLGATRYRVRVVPFEESLRPELDAVGEALSLGEREGPSQASGYPGAAFRRSAPDDAGESRVIVTASRVYVLEVSHPSGEDASADRFFDSLRIL